MKRWIVCALPLLLLLALCTVSAGAVRSYGSVQNPRYDGYTIRHGVDVSEHNGTIDWRAVAASGQADFAFVRVGYRGYTSGGLNPDSRYRDNLAGALDAGLDVGAYLYSQATTVAEAREEAYYALELLGSYAQQLTLPVVIDFEYAESGGYTGRLYNAKLPPSAATDICNAFCEVIRSAGLEPCVYANSVMLGEKMYAAGLTAPVWLANYTDETAYAGEYTYWQYTSSGVVAGFAGAVDCNYWYAAGPDRWTQWAEDLTMDEAALTVQAGESAAISASLWPAGCVDSLRYYSEDPTIAYVDKLSGRVTGFRAGTVQVWAETASGLWAACTVTVTGQRSGELSPLMIVSAPDTLFAGPDTRTALKVASASPAGAMGSVNIDLLNLRAWPSTDLAPVATMKNGEQLSVIDRAVIGGVGWLAVEWQGQRGFVSESYVDWQAGGGLLTEGVDYAAAYAGNSAPGAATVTVTGIGSYTGSASATFQIFSFADVQPGDWYYDAVLRAVQTSTMKGTGDAQFSPNAATSRAMMATVLHRMADKPAAPAAGFSDVADGAWYAAAVNWAAGNGIAAGTGPKTFDPNGMLTREVMVSMLYQFTRYLGYATPVDRSVGERFSDWSAVPESSRDAVCWAVGTGLIQGVGGNVLSLSSGATRAQMCTVLARYEALLEQQPDAAAQPGAPALAGD